MGGNAHEPLRMSDYPMFYLATIREQNARNVGRALAPLGMSPTEWRVLNLLSEQVERTVNDVAELAVIDRSKASRTIAQLTQRGWVARQEPESDRRKAELRLTDQGAEVTIQARGIMRIVYAMNVEGMSEDEQATLMRLLRRMQENVMRAERYASLAPPDAT